MGRYITTTARSSSKCTWKCIYCDATNLETAFVSASTQQSFGLIGVKRTQAEENTKNASVKGVREAIEMVNRQHYIPDSVSINGRCSHCNKTQPWALAGKLRLLRILLGIVLFVLIAYASVKVLSLLHLPISERNTPGVIMLVSIIAGAAAGYGFWRGSSKLLNRFAVKKMSALGNGYYPVIRKLSK